MTIWWPSSNTTLLTRISPPYPSFLHSASRDVCYYIAHPTVTLSQGLTRTDTAANMCDVWCREMTEWYKLLLWKSVGLYPGWLPVVSVFTGEARCGESLGRVIVLRPGPSGWWHNLIMLSPSQLVSLTDTWPWTLISQLSLHCYRADTSYLVTLSSRVMCLVCSRPDIVIHGYHLLHLDKGWNCSLPYTQPDKTKPNTHRYTWLHEKTK